MGALIYNFNTTITDTKKKEIRLRSSKVVPRTKYHVFSFTSIDLHTKLDDKKITDG